jgi:transcriptional regulator with PAS, ATPase and Fis domain
MTSSYGKFGTGELNSSEREGLLGIPSEKPVAPTFGVSSSPFESFPDIVGRSPAMMNVLETTLKVARASKSSSVLILGESGTGKELVARSIHRLSSRANREFIALNCSAIPEDLLEAELFGHEKGAFTGADKKREGVFSRANGGTIFLDEIGDMKPRLQAKLLRVLQEKKFSSVGSNKLEDIDVRIVAATNVDLEVAVERGEFRLDLYYRLNVLPISLPPLRERGEDVVSLLEYFIAKANIDYQKPNHCYLSSEVVDILKRYTWPGNVRQLQNLVDRIVLLKEGGRISLADLPSEFIHANKQSSLNTEQAVANKSQSVTIKESFDNSISEASSFTHGYTENSEDVYSSEIIGETDFNKVLESILLPDDGISLTKSIEALENHLILQALTMTGNNKNRAAKLLGMNRTTLVERIKKRGLIDLKAPSKEL